MCSTTISAPLATAASSARSIPARSPRVPWCTTRIRWSLARWLRSRRDIHRGLATACARFQGRPRSGSRMSAVGTACQPAAASNGATRVAAAAGMTTICLISPPPPLTSPGLACALGIDLPRGAAARWGRGPGRPGRRGSSVNPFAGYGDLDAGTVPSNGKSQRGPRLGQDRIEMHGGARRPQPAEAHDRRLPEPAHRRDVHALCGIAHAVPEIDGAAIRLYATASSRPPTRRGDRGVDRRRQ